jgi:hypothetical protein
MVPLMKTFIEGLEVKNMQFVLLLFVKIYMWIVAIVIMNFWFYSFLIAHNLILIIILSSLGIHYSLSSFSLMMA